MFNEIKNNIDFFIRNSTKFSRKNFIERNPDLIERNRLENLYTQDVLNQFFKKINKRTIKVLDIGSKNWFYAQGEYDFFKSFCDDFEIEGIELDAYRLYSNFYSRFEVAKYYTKGLENTNYIADNLLNLNKQYDYIIWFLPFVFNEPHKMWGLPEKYFYPHKLLKHAYSLLNRDGQMLIINQGELEKEEQKRLLIELNIPFKEKGVIKNEFFEYKYKRYAFLINKNNSI